MLRKEKPTESTAGKVMVLDLALRSDNAANLRQKILYRHSPGWRHMRQRGDQR